MKQWLIVALMAVVAATSVPTEAEAKRFGGGGFSGMQRKAPSRSAPDAPPPKPATPAQGQNAAPAGTAAAGAAPAAAAAKRSWMGPIAGLAAGLGIAALMSHLGLGEAFGNFLMLALLAVAAIFLVRFLMKRFGNNASSRQPAMAGAGAGSGATRSPWPAQNDLERRSSEATPSGGSADTRSAGVDTPPTSARMPEAGASLPAATATATATAAAAGATAAVPGAATPAAGDDSDPAMAEFVPAAFDSEGFTRIAKLIFIRMQAANDAADLDDLRRFTTPEMFAAARLEIQERGTSAQKTDVVKVDADVLDVANTAERQIVSVRFHGQIVEQPGQPASDFNEIWHLVKPQGDGGSWAIAGIQQAH